MLYAVILVCPSSSSVTTGVTLTLWPLARHSRRHAAPPSRYNPSQLKATGNKLVRACPLYHARSHRPPIPRMHHSQEAIDRPLTSDLENTKREIHPALTESRPHTMHDITASSNFLKGVNQKLLKETASLSRKIESRGKVSGSASR